MKTKLYILTFLVLSLTIFLLINKKNEVLDNNKLAHKELIDSHPYSETLKLSKKERTKLALPPNKYFEQEYLLEMNPETGKTSPEKIFALQQQLENDRLQGRSTPGDNGNDWVERGPNNVPGRTRAIMYDPNDNTHKRVFAGGVSGGLWVIDDIENSSSAWQRVGIPENLSVSSITYDVNDPNIFYVGTGESYVQGANNGNGVWKSSDGGNSWFHIFGGSTGESTVISDANLTINSGAINGNVYAATQTSNFGPALTTITGDLVVVDDGTASPTEGCNALINGANVDGKIAVIDRGNCQFSKKAKKAQDEGAIAVIILNNVSSFPFNMGGGDDADSITIPAVMMGQTDGTVIKNAITSGTINATLNPVTSVLPAGIVLIPGKFHVNDIVTRNNNGTTEIYAAISESMHTSAANLLGGEIGLYKSIDGGNTWTMVNLPQTSDGHPYAPNDLLITSDNKLWVATTRSWSFGDGGATIFSSSDGVNFTQKFSDSSNGNRTQIAASATDPNLIYILINGNDLNNYLKKTTNGFSSTTNLTLPADFGIVSGGNQAYYDLTLSVDPQNDNNVYLGGIYIYKSTNGGNSFGKLNYYYSWEPQIGSKVHVDIHNITFHPTEANKGVIGNDGGIYYMENSTNILERNNGYYTTQFYKGAIGQNPFSEKLLGGAQDNGSNLINNASAGINPSISVGGGDGMYCFIDKDNQYIITSVYQNAYKKLDVNGNVIYSIVYNQNEGDFVNVAELDDNKDLLFSNAHTRNADRSINEAKISRFTLGSDSFRTDLTNDLLTRPISAMKVSPYTTSSTTLFIGTDIGDIYKVTNASGFPTTVTWTDLTPEPYVVPFRGSISSINFGANEDEIMVTFHNYGVVSVFFTEDGGTTWQNKEGDLPDLPVKDILMNPLLNDEVIIATDLGVWKTSNFKDVSPHWVRSNNGMQNVKVTSFDFRTLDNTILASTYGRGLFTGQFTATPNATDDFVKNNKIEVYPTLTSGLINLKSSENLDNSTVQIFDVNGRKVYDTTLDINNTSKSINLNINQGIYFVNISNNDLKESHKIIIK